MINIACQSQGCIIQLPTCINLVLMQYNPPVHANEWISQCNLLHCCKGWKHTHPGQSHSSDHRTQESNDRCNSLLDPAWKSKIYGNTISDNGHHHTKTSDLIILSHYKGSLTVQVPPFMHGSETQSSMFVWQLAPVHPGIHPQL